MAALDTLAQETAKRAPIDPQDAVDQLRTRADGLRTQLAEQDLGARAQQAGELASERAHELEETVRARMEDLEPAATQAQIGLWRALRALFGGLIALPTLLFKVLRAVAGTLDDVVDNTDIEDRARRATALLPDRAPRVRRRTALLWTAGGVGVGVAGGYLLARRRAELDYDAPQAEYVDPVGDVAWQGDAAPRE